MGFNPGSFHPINVADTCSVWNVISSKILLSVSHEAGCHFCITSFVHYECLIKRRRDPSEADLLLMKRLREEQGKQRFQKHSCNLDDLQAIFLLENRKRLGKGELSSIAFAMRTRQGFITDDMKARRLSVEAGHEMTQTTSHLLGWLYFTNKIGDVDIASIIEENTRMGMPLEPHFKEAYRVALECRLNSR